MKRIVRKTMAYLLILAIVVFSFRLYMISSKEVVDTTQFTDYFQLDEADNGGLELTTSNFTTFEKEYNFVKEEKVEEDKKEGEKEKEKEKPAPPPPPKRAEQITYKVKKKDTIPAIAKRYGIKQDTILMNNKDALNNKMKVGDTITFPSIDGLYYKLEKNDTLAKIAKKYGISVVDIVDYNNINPKKLKAGSTIFLKGVTLQKYKDVEGRLIAAQQAKEDKKKNKNKEKEKEKEKPEKPPKETKGSPPPPPPEDNDDGGRSAAYSGAGFAYPVRYAGVSSPFGNRYHPVLKRYILHTGVDLVAKYVPLRAAKAGVVTFAGNMSGYGKIIIIRHDNGYETRYAHLSVISTNVGEHVNQGDLIGKTGNSGRTTGAHLHFEIRQNGVPKNPMKYLR
ncbi:MULTISPECIES: peptidoglycan DD-metalloendopeptidase family protein [Fusobacterium]|jgi:cell wall endopeptidase family M23/M37|uniref:peptidoglycan DD-metalloendopeptidase family protein n=1 Tax=Fusobacterium TaxID=848 RepID=UPI001CB631C1|nr:peptidoglycan DD-metalloendopeptidase family protein [Fusobacterium periodonticum]MBF1202814.1 peptidoglycan DD-metalloendopeptidase family protein [Fusobacterium periodonticum]MBF1207400.1 peptidoglycan DD-metalloendopeptidase family protein [Fusobacterium periodonticum]MDU5802560.1 peptidoglycan DD-metalloendopeptidase family protein [Fusobacterium periodonticum]